MKRFFSILSICLIFTTFCCTETQAQKGKAVKSIYELIKGGKKGYTPGIKPPVKPKSRPTKIRPRHNSTMITCPQCNGSGTVRMWNTYIQSFQNVSCYKCNGNGKVRK